MVKVKVIQESGDFKIYEVPKEGKVHILKSLMTDDIKFDYELFNDQNREIEEEDYIEEDCELTVKPKSNKGFTIMMYVLIGIGGFLLLMFLVSIFH